MSKIIPFFEVEGERYEIERTRFLECEYEKITQTSQMAEEDERAFANYARLQAEYEEIAGKFREAKDSYYSDITNKTLKEQYKAFKELHDEKYQEIVDFGLKNKDFSTQKIENKAYENGLKLLIVALTHKYHISDAEAKSVWDKYIEHFGMQTAKEWILFMVQSLFEREEEEDPFLKQAKAKAIQRAEQRKGLSKVRK